MIFLYFLVYSVNQSRFFIVLFINNLYTLRIWVWLLYSILYFFFIFCWIRSSRGGRGWLQFSVRFWMNIKTIGNYFHFEITANLFRPFLLSTYDSIGFVQGKTVFLWKFWMNYNFLSIIKWFLVEINVPVPPLQTFSLYIPNGSLIIMNSQKLKHPLHAILNIHYVQFKHVCLTIKHSHWFIEHGSSFGFISQMNKSIKPLNNKWIGVLGLKSVVLEISDSCQRINLFSNVKYGNFGVWKFPTDIFSAFFASFLMGF
jgi:hypothetical protein